MNSESLPKLYVKTGCPWCAEAIHFLDKHQLPFEQITVSGDPDAMREMIELSGQSKTPTLDWHGHILADFGEAELEPFLMQHNVLS